jgi:UDP-GlcNAc:undecaprenyl-phosphate GlcNAc-1-phosphate transferase
VNTAAYAAAVVAALASALAIGWLRGHPAALGLLDRPGQHKAHRDPVPAIGGVGIAIGVVLAWLLARGAASAALPLGLLGLLAVGLLDDRRGLGPGVRFAAQALFALGMALLGGVALRDFGALLRADSVVHAGGLALPLTVFCCVGVVNALNMIDGSDGLAGSLALSSLLALGLLAVADGHALGPLLLAGAAAVVAFLGFNLRIGRPARVFLGNGGSMVLGGLLAWAAVALSQGAERVIAPTTALWLLAVPLIDTVSVMWRRLASGRSPFAADHQHVHHLLLRAGCSVNGTLGLLLALQLACIATGVAMERLGLPEPLRAGSFLGLALGLHLVKRSANRRLPPLAREALH